ncbi:MAG: NfeD family protein [Planctomycetota bacterium]
MDYFFWSIVLLVLGLAIVGAELFIPSGGALGVVATIVLISAVVLAFQVNAKLGFMFIITIALIVPILVVALLRLWPHTAFGKRLLVQPPTGPEAASPALHQQQQLKQLIGQLGVAKTKMLPSGIIIVGSQSFDALGEGASIEPGQAVRVKRVEMSYLVVELYEGHREPARPSVTLETFTFDDPPL